MSRSPDLIRTVTMSPSLVGAILVVSGMLAGLACSPRMEPEATTPSHGHDHGAAVVATGTSTPTELATPLAAGSWVVELPGFAMSTVAVGLGDASRVAVGGDGAIFVASDSEVRLATGLRSGLVARLGGDAPLRGLAVLDGGGDGDDGVVSVYALTEGAEAWELSFASVSSGGVAVDAPAVVATWDGDGAGSDRGGNALGVGDDGSLWAAVGEGLAVGGVDVQALTAALLAAEEVAFDGCVPVTGGVGDAVWQHVSGVNDWDEVPGVADDGGSGPPGVLVGWAGVTSAVVYSGGTLPGWAGDVLVVTQAGQLWRLPVSEDDCVEAQLAHPVYPEHGHVLDVTQGANGELFLLVTGPSVHSSTNATRVLRLAEEASLGLLYPDLQTRPPSRLVMTQAFYEGEWVPVLRFTNVVVNYGEGSLEVRPSGQGTEVVQRLYASDGSWVERYSGEVVLHWSHAHWHFTPFNRFELWLREDYERMLAGEVTEPQWVEDKVSMCLMDNLPMGDHLPGFLSSGVYPNDCEPFQGISVGWGDSYPFDVPEQWVTLDESLGEGEFVLRSIVDSENMFFEAWAGWTRSAMGSW